MRVIYFCLKIREPPKMDGLLLASLLQTRIVEEIQGYLTNGYECLRPNKTARATWGQLGPHCHAFSRISKLNFVHDVRTSLCSTWRNRNPIAHCNIIRSRTLRRDSVPSHASCDQERCVRCKSNHQDEVKEDHSLSLE